MTARAQIVSRETLLVRVKTDVGLEGIGEASLHPFSPGGLGSLIGSFQELVPSLIGKDVGSLMEESLFYEITGEGTPGVSFAIETALLDILGQEKGLPIARLLGRHVRESIQVNALIASELPRRAATEAMAAKEAGYGCLKLKVGALQSLKNDLERLAAVREAIGPEVKIRLDANGAWGVNEAILAMHALEPFGIELIEQPVAASDLHGLKHVQEATGIPVAADEAIADVQSARRIVELGAASLLVLKPSVIGGIQKALKIASIAQGSGLKVYVTSSLDSSVGIAAALQLAAMLPEDSPACGLATAGLFIRDTVLDPPRTLGGRMGIPKAPGLGFRLDERALECLRWTSKA